MLQSTVLGSSKLEQYYFTYLLYNYQLRKEQ